MLNIESAYRVHCHFCAGIISSPNHTILDDAIPVCAMCEVEALMHDPVFAWEFDGATTPIRQGDDWRFGL